MQIKSHSTSTYLTFNNISSNSISIQILIVNNSAISYLKLLNVIIIMHNTFHDSQSLMKDNKVTKNSTQWKIYKVTKKNRLDIELQVKHILQHTIQGKFKQAVYLDTSPFDTCVKYCFFWRTGGSHLQYVSLLLLFYLHQAYIPMPGYWSTWKCKQSNALWIVSEVPKIRTCSQFWICFSLFTILAWQFPNSLFV